MNLTTDTTVYWTWGPLVFNATLLFTWIVMGLLVILAWGMTRRLSASPQISIGQTVLEMVVDAIKDQIQEISEQDPEPYLPFVGTLFTFIAVSNLLSVVPGFQPPTGSLSTTAALAICVFVAVPLFGIRKQGIGRYLKQYLQPTPLMLPFTIIGELSRTLALAVRLFGNVMSGTMIVGILLSIAPLFFPVVMQVMGLITGLIQAYIFAILAMVYIAAATRVQDSKEIPHE